MWCPLINWPHVFVYPGRQITLLKLLTVLGWSWTQYTLISMTVVEMLWKVSAVCRRGRMWRIDQSCNLTSQTTGVCLPGKIIKMLHLMNHPLPFFKSVPIPQILQKSVSHKSLPVNLFYCGPHKARCDSSPLHRLESPSSRKWEVCESTIYATLLCHKPPLHLI